MDPKTQALTDAASRLLMAIEAKDEDSISEWSIVLKSLIPVPQVIVKNLDLRALADFAPLENRKQAVALAISIEDLIKTTKDLSSLAKAKGDESLVAAADLVDGQIIKKEATERGEAAVDASPVDAPLAID